MEEIELYIRKYYDFKRDMLSREPKEIYNDCGKIYFVEQIMDYLTYAEESCIEANSLKQWFRQEYGTYEELYYGIFLKVDWYSCKDYDDIEEMLRDWWYHDDRDRIG